MRALCLFVAMFIFCVAASAQWTLVGEDGSGKTYLDETGPKQLPDGTKQAWIMSTFNKKQQPKGFMSRKVLYVFDCPRERMAARAFVVYAQPMGNGNPIDDGQRRDFQLDWFDVVPQSTGADLLKAVCAAAAR